MVKLMGKAVVSLIVFVLFASPLSGWEFERRGHQFGNEFSYAILPLPYDLPGIGKGFGLGGGALNINDSYIDAYGLIIGGDVEGWATGLADIHLIEKRLILDIGKSNLSKAAFAINYSRGMEGNEDPDDFNSAEISSVDSIGGQLVLTFEERRYELALQLYDIKFRLDKIRDKDGDILLEVDDEEEDSRVIDLGFTLDFTDDRYDPRSGLRFRINRNFPQDTYADAAKYFVVDSNVTAYFPMLTNSTWVFNYFESDAHVISRGETDRAELVKKIGLLPCKAGDTECETAREQVLDEAVAINTYGSASTLGGNSRLRSFISMRFRGAHTRFLGTEFRWNLTDENTRFNIWFMQDLRTAIQLAFFHETGTIADQRTDLWDERRHSTGIGLRAIMGSGFVYRAEYATGEEGKQFVLFFGYPWDVL